MNLNEMESSMLYKNILSINIKNNLKKMIATEEGTLTLYYFFESTILSKEITEKEMADGFIELLDTIQSPILMSKYRNKRKEIFLNINLLTSLFLYSKGNKLTNLDYCKVLSKAMNFKISEDEYNDYIYIFKEIFTDKNNYNNIYGMGNFLNEISKRYNIKLNISLQNGFNWNFLRIKPELIEAKSIKNEDTFSHIIGMLFFLVVRKFDNIRLFNNDIYPIYTKNLRCIANSIFGEDKYILSFFYDYIYKNGVVKYYIQKRENQEYYTLKKSEPNSDFIYLEEFEDKVKKKDYSL